ncbi:MAG: sensor histidine kinase [Pelobium sp.]
MTKKIILISIFCLLYSCVVAQKPAKDSLLKIAIANKLDSPTVSAFLNLGNIYKNNQDSSNSADYFFKALNLSKKIDFKRGIVRSYTQLGYLFEVTQDLPKAKIYYNYAIQYAKKNGFKKELALAYSYMYFIYSAKSEFSNAIIYADSALTIFSQLNRKPDIANQLNNIGIMNWKLHKNLEAIKYLQKTLAVYDQIGATAEVNKLNTYLNIGLVFEDLKSHDKAVEYFTKVIPLAKKYNEIKTLGDAYNDLGNVYLNTKKYESALYYYRLSLPLALKSDQPLKKGIAYANIATTLVELKRYEEAEKFMKLSNKEYQSIDNKEGIATNLVNSAKLLTETKRLNEADITLKKAMDIANKNNFMVLKQNIFESMAEVNKLKGEFTEAYLKQDSAYQLQNKNFNFETNKQIANLEVKYKTAEKEKEILKNKTELLIAGSQIQKRNYWLIISCLGIFLLAVATILIVRNSKLKRQKLEEENTFKLNIAKEQAKNEVQEEKLRISRELHDNIGAQLSFINGSIQKMVAHDEQNEELQQTQKITQNTIKELRSTVWLINQQEFSLEEFVVKLREYLKPYYGGKPQINIVDDSDKDYILAPIIATNLFRIVQEAVNNSLKYAEAESIDVSLLAKENNLKVVINDDGKGYDANGIASGYGLKNMQARVMSVKGSYNVDTKKDEGTQITLIIPI